MIKIDVHVHCDAYGWLYVEEDDLPDTWDDMDEDQRTEWIDEFALKNFRPKDIDEVEDIEVINHEEVEEEQFEEKYEKPLFEPKGWFLDSTNKKVPFADFKLCNQCTESICNCDSDEDGFHPCFSHMAHPIIGSKMECMIAKMIKKFPNLDKDTIYEHIQDGYTGDELIKSLQKWIKEFKRGN